MCSAKITFAMRCIFTAICGLSAEIHRDVGITASAMPRCGEFRSTRRQWPGRFPWMHHLRRSSMDGPQSSLCWAKVASGLCQDSRAINLTQFSFLVSSQVDPRTLQGGMSPSLNGPAFKAQRCRWSFGNPTSPKLRKRTSAPFPWCGLDQAWDSLHEKDAGQPNEGGSQGNTNRSPLCPKTLSAQNSRVFPKLVTSAPAWDKRYTSKKVCTDLSQWEGWGAILQSSFTAWKPDPF